jgi:hypothetical protein
MTFRLVLLTNGHAHGRKILKGLRRHQVPVHAVVHEGRPSLVQLWRQAPSLARRGLLLGKAAFRWWRGWHWRRRVQHDYQAYAEQVLITGPLNSERMRRDLLALRPDFLLLGGMGILKAPILEAARCGVLNTHPGLLPWVRGNGVVGRALERGYPVGGTCHYVDSGIDRGAVIERRLLPITGTETSLAELEAAADELVAEMMVEVVVRQLARGVIPAASTQTERFPLCKTLAAPERARVEASVRQGWAKILFESWRSHCLDPERLWLPSHFEAGERRAC